MKFSFKDFSSKCDQIHRKQDLVTFTEEILNGKLHFCAVLQSNLKIWHVLGLVKNEHYYKSSVGNRKIITAWTSDFVDFIEGSAEISMK